jgi:2-methylcitrate dehydratase PrpD
VHGDVQTRAIERNWIKLHPSCLGTHSPIEAAAIVRDQSIERDALTVVVHPTARRAAHLDTPSDGLEAKFSIPYCVAHTLLAGPPKLQDFAAIDPRVRESSRLVQVDIDPALPEFGAVLIAGGRELARVPAPKGSPENPASVEAIAGKLSELAGDHLDGLLDDLGAPAANALAAARLAGV